MPNSHTSDSSVAPGAVSSAAPASRAMPAALLALALTGLAVAVDLWILHARAHAGAGRSFCDVSERVSCTDVALSRWSVLLGVPQAAWGALAYLAVAGLAVSALLRRRPGSTWPAGILVIATGFMAAWSVYLALVSELALHKFCFMCATSWCISFGLLAIAAVQAVRAGGVAAALRADLRTVRENRVPAAAGGVALVALGLALLVSYALAPPPTHAATPKPTGGAIPVGPPGSLVVYEYSDYLCPFCAAIHTRERSIVAKRPDVRLVRRFFPLDATCNPGINTTVHEGACDLARGAICAEKQGRFDAYDDAAFANQATHPGPEDLAAQIGLDAAAFRACLGAPDTQERLRTDGLSGKQLGVHFTPAFLVQGKVQSADEFLARLGLSSELARP